MKYTNKIKILYFTKNYNEYYSIPNAQKYATKFLENEFEDIYQGCIYRFGFTSGKNTYDSVILIPKFQYKLLNAGMLLNKQDIQKLDTEIVQFYLEDAEEAFEEFYIEVFTEFVDKGLIDSELLSDITFNTISPDVGIHFENNEFTGYST